MISDALDSKLSPPSQPVTILPTRPSDNKDIKKVLGAFKDASNRVGRVDKDLQEVLDSQVYIIEELLQ